MKVEGKLLLVAAAFCLQAALVQAWARTCSLEREGVHSVMVRSKSASARDDAGHGRTLGLSGRERAVLVAKHNAERKQRGDDDGAHNATVSSDLVSAASNGAVDTSTSEPPIVDDDLVPFEGRPCNCAHWLGETEDLYYCPKQYSYCSYFISTSRLHEKEESITCFSEVDWRVVFSRQTWYYLMFMLLFLCLYPFVSRQGQHCTKFLLSKCFPGMNLWIADRILELERSDRDRFVREFERATQIMRRDEGLLTAYDVKTRRYAEAESGEVSERDVDLSTPSLEQPLELEQTCSICLLAFEEGETVTDLTCGHLYHAECVSEWLLKKNECPLCKNPIASEVRTFNQDEDGDDEASVGRRQGLVPRLRKYTWDNFIEMATGRAVRPRLPGIPQAPV
mmetsp:Transcript_27161/g.64488  ORF Transcript_27161/g.64488 Transcript_27161/m.64488 type:complete len:394 (+) Transcript_27161:152-1333(+)